MNCVFCDIVKHKRETYAEYEDDKFMAFNDIKPSAPIHILIVPKKHIDSIKSVDGEHKELLGEMIVLAKKIALEKKLEGYKLIFNVGRQGGQIVDHLHLHLLGGWEKS
ncbi:MAG: histidine triad nucleotide-binding protein [Candidatus Tagabacteria bacterium RIFCSPLOWO2_01_FULL_39_11]|uniref:Histidine triad nucleotide-binding protein n=1 Tax=Candidatus Tagabacteria bacterium RIFCSPLOWO2_01_FULL_39_11 TaxID=1802295 RepID=A0A1G2LR81_9BACT|nr:MAG: histidine triad nucleotide-binding protein [Candidatus Tagabacteria bacterium RIFCSPLOWO2_01_FULL_39_11]